MSDALSTRRLARLVLVWFLVTFLAARITVFLIMSHSIPDLFLHLGGTHVHHLNYGIFLLAGVGGFLVFARPAGRALRVAAALYAIGLGLTFDEFGMWLHLGGPYWQRASFDAIVVIAALLALLAYMPRPDRTLLRHWPATLLLIFALVVFGTLLVKSLTWAGHHLAPDVHRLEAESPQ
ncbi:MAG: hypothetical protein AB1716_18205 [Planctomycetota bacterium]